MNRFDLNFFKAALKKRLARFEGQLPFAFSGICIDSRQVRPGEIFVAIKGESLDGHHYISDAMAKGASAALVQYGSFKADAAVPSIFVDNTQKALTDLARTHLKSQPGLKIALTGSNGKTTTKELIKAAISACVGADHVFASYGNFNNHIGLPLNALETTSAHQFMVFEMGMNHFGEIQHLAGIVEPQIGLITNIGSAHCGNLGGPEGVAKAKGELFEALGKDAVAIVNVDDPRCVREAAARAKCKHLSFGRARFADVRVVSTQPHANGLSVEFSYQGQLETVELKLSGEHNALNAAAALAVAVSAGCDFKKAAQGLSQTSPVHGRLNVHTTKNDVRVIDDTYNANFESMEAAFGVLANLGGDTRKIVVLGEMAELGDNSVPLHRAVGALCAKKGLDYVFACGPNAHVYGEGALEAGLAASRFVWEKDPHVLAQTLVSVVQPHDTILVKGSRSSRMERIVEALLEKAE